ncbi:MAG: outer membrane protein transport protein [Desulfobacterium sp.]|nr:outer membrane protein transport protein [Desulfobacterium sp.]
MAASICHGAAFALLEWSARGEALGAGMVARADDPSAVAYNPAGITQLSGYNVQTTSTMVTVQSTVETKNVYDGSWDSNSNDREYHILPTAFITAQVSEKLFLGFGTFTRFGLGVNWDKDWPGRYSTTSAELKCFSGNGNLAYKITDSFSVAAGIEVITADVTLENTLDATRIFHATGQTGALTAMGLPTTVNDPSTNLLDVKHHLKGDATETAYNLALHYKPSDRISMGVSYRSRVTFKADGRATFDKSPTVNALPLPDYLYAPTNFKSEITVPDMLFTGIMFRPKSDLTLEFTTLWTNFSVYDKMEFVYDSPAIGVDTATMAKNYSDTWRLGLSAEWNVKPWLALRAAYVYDESPIDENHTDYLCLDNDRNMFSFGAGYKKNRFECDIGYMYILFDDLDTNSRQTVDGFLQTNYRDADAHILGMNISYTF